MVWSRPNLWEMRSSVQDLRSVQGAKRDPMVHSTLDEQGGRWQCAIRHRFRNFLASSPEKAVIAGMHTTCLAAKNRRRVHSLHLFYLVHRVHRAHPVRVSATVDSTAGTPVQCTEYGVVPSICVFSKYTLRGRAT